MDTARTRLHGSAREILDFLELLEAIEQLATKRATGPDLFPASVGPLIDTIKARAEPARLHRLGYQVAVVFGYAAFERYIRDLIVLVAGVMSSVCPTYDDLPGGLRENHLRLTLKAASVATERSTYDEPAVGAMLARLLACIDGIEPYVLNGEVFADHQANFRTSVLREALRRVGVDVAEERTTPDLSALLGGELNGLYARTSSVIDDLAERRNQAAHGDEIELLDRSTLGAIVRFIRAYADALADDAFDHLARVVARHQAREIGRVQHTWSNPNSGERTICRLTPSTTIAAAQRILVAGARMRLATIQSIELEHVSLELAGPSDRHYGIDVSVPVHDGERLYAVPHTVLELIEGLAQAGSPL